MIDNNNDNDNQQDIHIVSVNSKYPHKFERDIISNRFKHINRVNGSKAAALSVLSPIAGQQQKTILTKNQLLQCADAYTNSGVVRSAVNRHIDYILGDRTKFAVELNEELTEFATDEEKDKLQKELESEEIKRLRTNIIRVNKRVNLHDNMVKLLQNVFVFGRGALQIVRFPKNNNTFVNTETGEEIETPALELSDGLGWPTSENGYGEPQALLPLNTSRIVDVKINSRTGAFEGFYYDYGIVNKNKVLIKNTELIPAFIDDCNLYESTLYSGLSPLWPILNVVMANQVIDDEDIPEATKQSWAKFGFVYAGTAKQSTTDRIKKQLEAGTFLVHNQEKLTAEVHDLARSITELTDVRRKNAEYILQCLGLPIFFMFEDSPNHATAIASLQAYKAGTLKRYRTWVRNILETYWYDPILADHYNMKIEDVISLRVKVKATFEDIVFDTFKDQVSALMSLHNAGVYDDEKILKELGADDVWQRKRELEKILEEQALEEAKSIDEISDKEGLEQEQGKTELLRQKQELSNNANGFNRNNRFPTRK